MGEVIVVEGYFYNGSFDYLAITVLIILLVSGMYFP